MKMKRVLTMLVLAQTLWISAYAQGGKIAGKILDASNGDALIGCNVSIVGTKLGTTTDLDGNFIIAKIPAGKYSVEISYISYNKKIVTNINVTEGLTSTLKISLEPESLQGNEIVVEARADKASSGALLVEQRKSSVVSDAIGGEQISKTPDKNAGDALKRVTGLTVVGNKYVYVRGLGERYSQAQLNGIELPSPENEKKIIPMDIFPASSIENIVVEKTYNPDSPADFAGGLVKINTKEFPDQFYASINLSGGLNSASFGQVLNYQGGSHDFLGFDDGKRARPNVPRFNVATDVNKTAVYNNRFQNQWTPRQKMASPNGGFSASVGNSFQSAIPFGYLASLTYSQENSKRDENEFFPVADETAAYDFKNSRGTTSVLWGALLDANVKLTPNNKLGIKTVYNVQSEDESMISTGLVNGSTSGQVRQTRLRFTERNLFSSQILGSHQINGFLNSKLDWHAAFSSAGRSEPDTRQTYYLLNTATNNFEAASSSKNTRFFSDLKDQEFNTGFDFSLPITLLSGSSKVKVGTLQRLKNRDFNAYRYSYANVDESVKGQAPEQLFTSQNISNGNVTFFDDTQPNDQYDATEKLFAYYVMGDILFSKQWRVVGGARYEDYRVKLNSFDPASGSRNTSLSPKLSDAQIYPAINVVFGYSENVNLRLSVSQTKARPQFRELAPFRYDDGRRSTFGNPFLTTTDIQNYDLRWEFFPRSGEVMAVSAFYKFFDHPIERFLLPSGSSQAGDPVPVNGDQATNYGLEFEFRKGLDFIAPWMEDFSASSNVTIIRSEVQQNDAIKVYVLGSSSPTIFNSNNLAHRKRPMQGQSPYILNLALNYQNPKTRTDVNILYNRFGQRLSEIGTKAINASTGKNTYDDIYEMPFDQLDVTIAQKLSKAIRAKISVKNILNEATSFKMGKFETLKYKTGRSFSASINYDF